MNKKTFIKLITEYQEHSKIVEEVYDIINIDSSLFTYSDTLFTFILESNFDDEQIDWIEWWLYEYSNGCKVYDEDNKEIDLDSIEKLWNFIQNDTNK